MFERIMRAYSEHDGNTCESVNYFIIFARLAHV